MANVNFNGQSASGGASSLNQLTDVNITSPSDDQVLTYDNGEWINKAIPDSADDISYDNTTSGLTADDVQEALDEIEGNVETKANSADVPLKTQISNPNLLDNPWFTVNQRGYNLTSGTATDAYHLDRWTGKYLLDASTKTPKLDSTNNSLIQYLGDKESIDGRTVTLSVLYGDGTIDKATFVYKKAPSNWEVIFTGKVMALLGYNADSSANINGSIVFDCQSDCTVKAVKLEVGSISTLALDTAPNYATELLKCQRYYYKIEPVYTYQTPYICVGVDTTFGTGFSFPTEMRITPAISNISLTPFFGGSTITGVSANTTKQGIVNFFKNNSLVSGERYYVIFEASADL